MTTIADIMTRSIATVRRDETLQAAAGRMREMDVGALPVVDGKALAGMVTDRDIAVRGVAAGMIPQESLVSDVMTEDVRFCRADDSVEQVMARDGRRCRCAGCRCSTPATKSSASLPWRPGHATIGPHRRNSARDLDARSLTATPAQCTAALPERAPDRPGGAARAAPSVGVRCGRRSRRFSANQGLLLAGAVAYYALLSIVPLLILTVIALSHVIDQARAARDARPLPRMAGAGRSRRRSSPSSPTSSTSARASAGCCSAR